MRAENLAKKIALCERAEALADSTNWIQTADEIKKLQAEWKTIGPVTRGQEKAIWERFRAACDRFFTRRHADLAERKTVWAENLAKKEALCVKAEALAESTDWEPAAAEIKRLQAEWKTIGPVKKSRSEAIWQRFRGACDRVLRALRAAPRHGPRRARRGARSDLSPSSKRSRAADATGASPRRPISLATVRALRAQMAAGDRRARRRSRARGALDERFAAAFAAVVARWPAAFAGTDLDPDANRKRMEALVQRDGGAGQVARRSGGRGADAALSPTTRLAAMLKEALAANTIGGKVDDDSRFRAAAEEVRQAQAAWSRIGPCPRGAAPARPIVPARDSRRDQPNGQDRRRLVRQAGPAGQAGPARSGGKARNLPA